MELQGRYIIVLCNYHENVTKIYSRPYRVQVRQHTGIFDMNLILYLSYVFIKYLGLTWKQ